MNSAALSHGAGALRHVHRGPELPAWEEQRKQQTAQRLWNIDTLGGRLCELTSDGKAPLLSITSGLLLEAQQRGQPTVWVSAVASCFFPPDIAAWGIDLAALPIVRVQGARAAARATDHLLRSGAFGMAVLDLGADLDIPIAAQTRLCGLAKKHHSILLCLTKPARQRTLGSMVSLRATAQLHAQDHERFHCEIEVLKDKRQGPGWKHTQECRAPEGLAAL